MSITEIGCCGAYCKTCIPFRTGFCAGCKTGYQEGERDIRKAKCRIKLCVIHRNLNTCADCPDFSSCPIIQSFYRKRGYKYGKYRQSMEFIRTHGYEEFIRKADTWKNAYGSLEDSPD